jgi:Pectinacetylesterase
MFSSKFLGRFMLAVLALLAMWSTMVHAQIPIDFTPPIQSIDFVARHGGTCNVAGVGVPGGALEWLPITDEVTPCSAGATDCLQKVMIDTTSYPNARCNDGSPAVMYVRINPVSSRNWLIHLQAGGDCNSYDSCYQRWCGLDSYSASKMSSKHTPNAMAATGIFKDDPSNTFRTWNVVHVYYCSSDEYRGTVGEKGFVSAQPGSPGLSVLFNGYAIVDSIFGTLQSGGVVTTASGSEIALPDLDQAAQVVFSGSSAGSIGVRFLADDYATRLRTSNPDVDFRIVLDSANKPGEAWAADELDGTCDSTVEDQYVDVADLDAQLAAKDTIFGAVQDASCLAAHTTNPQRCSNPGHVASFHVTTPMFLRQGLLEKLGDDNGDDVPDVDVELWKNATRDLIQSYGNVAYVDPVTGETREPFTITSGWFGPDCSTHVALENSRFFDEEVVLNGGAQFNYATVLSNWVAGIGQRKAIQHDVAPIFDPAGYTHRSVCDHKHNMKETLPVCH